MMQILQTNSFMSIECSCKHFVIQDLDAVQQRLMVIFYSFFENVLCVCVFVCLYEEGTISQVCNSLLNLGFICLIKFIIGAWLAVHREAFL